MLSCVINQVINDNYHKQNYMIHIFCALHCEAITFIEYYKLVKQKSFNLFPVYQSNDKNISLTISGVGKLNAAAAVCYHHGCFNTKPYDIWLNIGIAGHHELEVGKLCLVNKITDFVSKKNWYPQIIFIPPCACAPLHTLDRPCSDYHNVLFDMEASGFYQMAMRISSCELIHCIKIVSDNHQSPAYEINKDNTKNIIKSNIKNIEGIINLIKPMSEEMRTILEPPKDYALFIEKWHFTTSQCIQLKKLLRQLKANMPELKDKLIYMKNGKDVINYLQKQLIKNYD